MKWVEEEAPAKLNLWLEVLRRREDGYHDLQMVNVPVGLHDRVRLIPRRDAGVQLEIFPTSLGLPEDCRNTAYRAAMLVQQHFPSVGGVRLQIFKKIPVGAGLAGGSSDAAATLRGMNRLFDLGIPLSRLVLLGAAIGSDVPFCVYNGLARVEGRGERVVGLTSSLAPLWVVLVKPALSLPTAFVFARYASGFTPLAPSGSMDALVQAIHTGDYTGVCRLLYNSLESTVCGTIEMVACLRDRLLWEGADAVLLSGSGPTVCGFVPTKSQALSIQKRLLCDEMDWEVFVAPLLSL